MQNNLFELLGEGESNIMLLFEVMGRAAEIGKVSQVELKLAGTTPGAATLSNSEASHGQLDLKSPANDSTKLDRIKSRTPDRSAEKRKAAVAAASKLVAMDTSGGQDDAISDDDEGWVSSVTFRSSRKSGREKGTKSGGSSSSSRAKRGAGTKSGGLTISKSGRPVKLSVDETALSNAAEEPSNAERLRADLANSSKRFVFTSFGGVDAGLQVLAAKRSGECEIETVENTPEDKNLATTTIKSALVRAVYCPGTPQCEDCDQLAQCHQKLPEDGPFECGQYPVTHCIPCGTRRFGEDRIVPYPCVKQCGRSVPTNYIGKVITICRACNNMIQRARKASDAQLERCLRCDKPRHEYDGDGNVVDLVLRYEQDTGTVKTSKYCSRMIVPDQPCRDTCRHHGKGGFPENLCTAPAVYENGTFRPYCQEHRDEYFIGPNWNRKTRPDVGEIFRLKVDINSTAVAIDDSDEGKARKNVKEAIVKLFGEKEKVSPQKQRILINLYCHEVLGLEGRKTGDRFCFVTANGAHGWFNGNGELTGDKQAKYTAAESFRRDAHNTSMREKMTRLVVTAKAEFEQNLTKKAETKRRRYKKEK